MWSLTNVIYVFYFVGIMKDNGEELDNKNVCEYTKLHIQYSIISTCISDNPCTLTTSNEIGFIA